jgi:GT2 family glycosyltransferase
MGSPLVSIVVPTFNRAYCLPRTIDSILTQTHRNIEVIVVDDGSTDRTRDVVASLCARDSRVRYQYQGNQGANAARNQGIRLSRGGYVALLDSDDTWLPWKLQLQVACLERFPEVGMVWTDMEAVGADGAAVAKQYMRTMYEAYRWFSRDHLFSRVHPLSAIVPELHSVAKGGTFAVGDIFSQMVMGNLVHTSTVVVKRERLEKVGGFNEELQPSGGDYDFHLRTCKEGLVGFIDLSSIRYQTGMPDRLSGESTRLSRATNCLRTILPILEKDRARLGLSLAMIRSRLAEVHHWIGETALDVGLVSDARRHLLASLRHDPLQPRALRLLALSFLPFRLGLSIRKLFRLFRPGSRPAHAAVR